MKTLEPTKFIKQIVDFQKMAFDNTYKAIIMVQGQTEKVTETALAKNSMIPEEGQKMLREWMLALKNNQENFKKTMDENFKKLESFASETIGNTYKRAE